MGWRVWSIALLVLMVWVLGGLMLSASLQVHSGSFLRLFLLLFVWALGIPIALSFWLRKRAAGLRGRKP